jgi:hypothetical protein
LTEEWRDVVGYEGLYQVSNTGLVKSIFYNDGLILYQTTNPQTGYKMLTLVKSGEKNNTVYVHRLVAMAFISQEEGKPIINHINEIKTDNRVENLEWCTYQYNNLYNGKVKKCYKPIEQISQGVVVAEWENARRAAEKTKANYKNISACCRGLRKTAGGYAWKFKEVV